MNLGIMQPYFFPYMGYFQLIHAVDKIIIYDHVSFRKRSWITRNRIMDKSLGEPVFVGVPVHNGSSFQLIRNTRVVSDGKWQAALERKIFFNYKQAPFFKEVFPVLCELIHMSMESLHGYNATITIKLARLLGIETEIVTDNTPYLEMEERLPALAEESGYEVKTQRVLEMCRNEGADAYINPIGGQEIYSKAEFAENDLELNFVKSELPPYQQFAEPFVPYLSIIDELMHLGISETAKRVQLYHFV